MDTTSKKFIALIASLLFVTVASVYLNRSPSPAFFNLNNISNHVGNWTAYETPVENRVKEILETDHVYSLIYNKGNDNLGLSIVFYPLGNPFYHLPEGCTVGAGESILNKEAMTVKDAWGHTQLQYLEVVNGLGVKTSHLYAFVTQDAAYGNFLKFRLHLLRQKIMNKPQASALFRIFYTHNQVKNDLETKAQLIEFWHAISGQLRSAIIEN